MKRSLPALTALALLLVPASAFADGKPAEKSAASADSDAPAESGFSLAARVSYALPMGTLAKDQVLRGTNDMTQSVAGALPIGIDAGYRITPRIYLGGYFQFAPVFASSDVCNRAAGPGVDCSSSGNDIRFGAFAKYGFAPDAKFSPWAGVGFGYEILNGSATVGGNSFDSSVKGFEFVSLHLGGDFHAAPSFSIGPAVSMSFAQYSSYSRSGPGFSNSGDFKNTGLHEWFTIGLRGQYDL
jgi:opacity protein-like surface antigen